MKEPKTQSRRKPKHEIRPQPALPSNSFVGREPGGGTRSAYKRGKRSLQERIPMSMGPKRRRNAVYSPGEATAGPSIAASSIRAARGQRHLWPGSPGSISTQPKDR